MANPEYSLIPTEVSAQIAPLTEGGLISHALGAPEKKMDRIITEHLDRVALLNARGDTVPERPIYIFNPDSRLLISYSLRRDENPARSGLFAEVVELDDKGKPRFGVGVVNPFQTKTGFINVSIGDNNHGFAPSSVEMKLDSDDPLQSVPLNIETADLISMLNEDPISPDESFESFISRTDSQRNELRNRATAYQRQRYIGTVQGLTNTTNTRINLIISDRESGQLEAASREVGLFPVVVSIDDLLETYRFLYPERDAVKGHSGSLFSFSTGTWSGRSRLAALPDFVPGVITFDYPFDIDRHSRKTDSARFPDMQVDRLVETVEIVDNLVMENPIFAVMLNEGLHPEYDGLKKIAHGEYKCALNPHDIDVYVDWLRKIKLDMALTLYLRGLSEVVTD